MRRLGTIAAVVLTMAAVLVVQAPVQARTQGTLTISPPIGVVEKSYPGITGVKPRTPVSAVVQLNSCKDAQANSFYCDQVNLKIAVPKNYPEPFYKVRVELTWDASIGNDIVMYVFDIEDSGSNVNIVAQDAAEGKKPPRVVQFFEPPKAVTYYISILNLGPGPNTGYNLKVSWIVSDLSFPDEPRNDEPEPSFSPISSKTAPPTISGSDVSAPLDGEETVTVRVPGPDGELIDVEIPLVKAAGLSKKAENGASPVVPIILGLLGLGLALFLYFFVWRRRRGEAT